MPNTRNNMYTKRNIALVVGLGIVVSVFIFNGHTSRSTNTQNNPPVQEQRTARELQISERVVTATGEPTFEERVVGEGTTALDLTQEYYEIEKQGEGINAFVTGIDGVAANQENSEFWSLYVNGEPAQVGAGSYELQDGDVIEWKIETY